VADTEQGRIAVHKWERAGLGRLMQTPFSGQQLAIGLDSDGAHEQRMSPLGGSWNRRRIVVLLFGRRWGDVFLELAHQDFGGTSEPGGGAA